MVSSLLVIMGMKFLTPAWSAEPAKFIPPKPPTPEQELEDEEEEDQPSATPPPPAMPGQGSAAQPPPSGAPGGEFRSAPSANNAQKVQFHLVDGTFYEKGKPRGRAEIPYRKKNKSESDRR